MIGTPGHVYKRATLLYRWSANSYLLKVGDLYVYHSAGSLSNRFTRLSGPEYMHGVQRRRFLSSDRNKTRGRTDDNGLAACNVGRSYV